MSSVIIVANKGFIFKRNCKQDIPRNNFFLSIIHSECPSFPDYVGGAAKAGIGLMNVGQ